jgi:hypothetical protein
MTGLTLTDGGHNIHKQQSKLWASSNEIHQASSADIVTVINRISISNVQAGAQAIIEEHLPPLVPSRSRVLSPTPSRSNLPRPAAFACPAPKGKASVRKAMSIIELVEAEARTVVTSLTFEDSHCPSDDVLQKLLDAAAIAVDSGGKSLSLVRNQAKDVVNLKE